MAARVRSSKATLYTCWKVKADLVRVHLENGTYGYSRFCNTDFDYKLACLNLSGV
ncbi:hypothetical protein [Rahnella inusitata]|uniref:hypothetical protein n=1 Tax=Rahnella inusitata TaxID=58169 RepID=UPI001FD1A6A5|nr:hypothetical protein [Rahnella inusitata]